MMIYAVVDTCEDTWEFGDIIFESEYLEDCQECAIRHGFHDVRVISIDEYGFRHFVE